MDSTDSIDPQSQDSNSEALLPPSLVERLLISVPRMLIPMFALFFLAFALLYAGSAVIEFVRPILESGDIVGGLVKGLHMGVVALPVYELALIVNQEYDQNEKPDEAVKRIHRGVIRFASVVFVALILESLIMVIKYSQQDLAGFLYYPVAIITSSSVLLVALGVYSKLSGTTIVSNAERPQ